MGHFVLRTSQAGRSTRLRLDLVAKPFLDKSMRLDTPTPVESGQAERHAASRLVAEALDAVIARYPAPLRPYINRSYDRFLFDVSLAEPFRPGSRRVCDVGGGYSPFTAVCAALGARATLIDDFLDPWFGHEMEAFLRILDEFGVEVVRRDAPVQGAGLLPASVDVVTCFHSMEHWHCSPKALFHELTRSLVPGGSFILAGPNAVNLRKRISCLFGRYTWSPMWAWYEEPTFRSHVREPDVRDLRYIGSDLGLVHVRIIGKNWMGLRNQNPVIAWAARFGDRLLQEMPALCSDIYLLGAVASTPVDSS